MDPDLDPDLTLPGARIDREWIQRHFRQVL